VLKTVISPDFRALADKLSLVLGRPVDLVTEEGLSPYIRPFIEEEMVILYKAE
jgi:predicted nucleotidyltransferase